VIETGRGCHYLGREGGGSLEKKKAVETFRQVEGERGNGEGKMGVYLVDGNFDCREPGTGRGNLGTESRVKKNKRGPRRTGKITPFQMG